MLNSHRTNVSPARRASIFASALVVLFTLSGCTQDTANSGESVNQDESVGFNYDAPQDEVDAILADLEPVTLTYQPTAPSADSTAGPSALMFKEYVEERSGGKIEIDIIWGQAVADYTEVTDALIDGRLDIAYAIPAYEPSEYPAFNALMAYSQLGPTSTLADELATGAMMTELAWSNDAVLAEFEDKGLRVLSSMLAGGEYYVMCNPSNAGVDASDWQGRSIRAGSTMNEIAIAAVDSTPVSLAYPETYEALQRNTIDCAFVQFAAATNFGVPEAAPNINYMSEGSFAGRASNVQLAGSSFEELPLAYQQIIFDAEPYSWAGYQNHVVDSKALGVEQALAAGGDIQPFAEAAEQSMIEGQLQAIRDGEDAGLMEPEVEDEARNLAEKWAGVPEELGYEDGGELIDINDWYAVGEVDFLPFAEHLYEEVVLPHRPQ